MDPSTNWLNGPGEASHLDINAEGSASGWGQEEHLLRTHWEGRQQLLQAATSGRQQLIVVASLIDRVPNLAGLARTCEVRRIMLSGICHQCHMTLLAGQ